MSETLRHARIWSCGIYDREGLKSWRSGCGGSWDRVGVMKASHRPIFRWVYPEDRTTKIVIPQTGRFGAIGETIGMVIG